MVAFLPPAPLSKEIFCSGSARTTLPDLDWLGDRIEERVVQLTPDVGRFYLEFNTPYESNLENGSFTNRKPSQNTIDQYASSQLSGRWDNNNLPTIQFAFPKKGRTVMGDGQQTCMSVIRSGVSVRVRVRFGVPIESFAYLDHNRPRNMVALMEMSNDLNIRATPQMISQSTNHVWTGVHHRSALSALGYLALAKLLEPSLRFTLEKALPRGIKGIVDASVRACIILAHHNRNTLVKESVVESLTDFDKKALRFCDILAGAPPIPSQPAELTAFRLSQQLQAESNGRRRTGKGYTVRAYRIRLTAAGLLAYLRGEERRQIQVVAGSPDPFPLSESILQEFKVS